MKRPLTDKEREFTEKNLVNTKIDLEYADAMLKQTQLAIDIAPVIYKQQVKDLHKKLENIKQVINEGNFNVTTTEDQLKFGVEVREVTEIDS